MLNYYGSSSFNNKILSLAIVTFNKKAFVRNNPNYLYSGKKLYLPSVNEIKNLIIYKKGLFNADFANENELLNILNPIIKSESVWNSHALYLMAEYYFAKNEKQKSKEFFNQIVSLENSNSKIKLEAQKRLRADFSE